MPIRSIGTALLLLIGLSVRAQGTISDSTYLRIPDRIKAREAIRFDLDAYQDTLRQYRDAVDRATTTIDASTPQAEDRRARLGHLRNDMKALDKEMARTRKRMKKTSVPFEELARTCAQQVQRTRTLREGMVRENVRMGP